ncbi:MAG: FAD-dependent oxidoreductase [Solobacterium sp.]|nr:FAD-dependent oxidoreductase [Solobacterium sp.]MCH4222879.1 FAD-dependent oxidoreductase [Solobacterium sp.]MCH4266226.1 FAD-dependent oxidoreductase [Solobacterium sp.]
MRNQEAARCLLCRNARCSAACPVHTDVPACQKLYRENKLNEAGKLLFDNNPLSAVTCQVCDWRRYCLGHCVLGIKGSPIRWYEIEQEISEQYLFSCHPEKAEPNGKRVAIVGAGPVGITAGIRLAEKGYTVTLYDDNDQVGGVLRYGIPPFRLDKKYCDEYERILNELGVRMIWNSKVDQYLTLSHLILQHDAVLLGVGATKQNALGITGEDRSSVLEAIAYLKNPSGYDLGKKVIVIGGGNVAMDACRTAVRSGCDTHVYYRKTYENMPANPREVEEARDDGVMFHDFKAPVEVKEHSVIFRDCENYQDENGRTKTRILDGTDEEVECDTLLVAAGETIDLSVFGKTMPQLNEYGYPIVNEGNMTSIRGVFVAGDFILGAKTVVEAVESTKTAVAGIEQYLG